MSRGRFAKAWFGGAAFGAPPWAAGWGRGPFGPGRHGWHAGPGPGFGPGFGGGFGPGFNQGFGPGFGWGQGDDPHAQERAEMLGLMGQLGSAAAQVAQSAGEEQLIEAQQVLKDAQRALYRILAREEPGDLAPPTTEA